MQKLYSLRKRMNLGLDLTPKAPYESEEEMEEVGAPPTWCWKGVTPTLTLHKWVKTAKATLKGCRVIPTPNLKGRRVIPIPNP